MTTEELRNLLQRHYIKPGAPLPGGIFVAECGWNGRAGGTCDALYIGFTSSSGRLLVGHELKVSRADWVRELGKKHKADAWADECHQWYLVVPQANIVRRGELPAGWGLMVPGRSKTRMDVVVKAESKGRDHQPSWLAVRSILARQDTLRANSIEQARRKMQQESDEHLRRAVAEAQQKAPGITPDVQWAMRLVELVRTERRWRKLDDGRVEQLASAVCEVLDGGEAQALVRRELRTKVQQLDTALSDIRQSWGYKELRTLLRGQG